MLSSHRTLDRLRRGCASTLLTGCSLVASTTAALAADTSGQPGQTLQAQERRVLIPATQDPGSGMRLNSTGRPVTLTIPTRDGSVYLGDIVVTIDENDVIAVSAQRLLDLLANVVDPDVLRTLQQSAGGRTTLSLSDFESIGIRIRYNPQELALILDVAAERRATRALQVSPLDRGQVGTFIQPADFSAYLNVRGNLDYLWEGQNDGIQSPVMFLDGAARVLGTVAESEAIWQPGATGIDMQRLGSRLVYDDQKNLMRWSVGDLQTVGRGFQASPDLAGLSIFRSYSVLQPQRIIRPRGDRSFRLERPSTVEVFVNGMAVRRLQLTPGNYDLRDFPFTQGANDIRLAILDDAGRTEVLRFNVFLDQSQLARGLTEFGLYAGVLAPLGRRGPNYTDDLAISGFIRHGVSDRLTLGANVQGDGDDQMGGVEAVLGTPIGTIAANFSISNLESRGSGFATLVTFQRLIQRPGGRADSFSLFVESRSRDFGALGTIQPNNPYDWEIGGGYAHAFSDNVYGGIDGRFSHARDGGRDVHNVRGTLGWRLNDRMSATGDVRWERDSRGSRVGALASVTIRLGRFSNGRADYDTRNDRARLSYTTLRGQGVGSYNIAADVERSDFGSGTNFNSNYFANRAELGFSHFGTFQNTFGTSTNQRTSLRFGTSFAIADGAVSVGRPIYDSFAIIRGHRSLDGSEVLVDRSPFGFTATTGSLGTATHPSLSSYAERTIAIDAPAAPAGVDLGQGSFRLLPAYRSGYLLQVGSEYSITALGRLLNRDGEPVSLVTGTAREIAHPEREPVPIFTNRDGRFGASGLAPGRWRIEMLDDQRSTFTINVPETAEGVYRAGELRATQGSE
jgi:outer membrane usher protein